MTTLCINNPDMLTKALVWDYLIARFKAHYVSLWLNEYDDYQLFNPRYTEEAFLSWAKRMAND